MKALKGIPVWTVIVIVLLLANLGWMSWNLYQHAVVYSAIKQFKLELVRTNDMSGVGLFETKSNQPIWMRLSKNNRPVGENHFFQGKDVFDVFLSSNSSPKYSVFFHGPGKSVTWWLDDAGKGSFTERLYYNTNGDFYKREVWYNQGWYIVDRRNGTNGVVVDGAWRQVHLDTNGMWTIEAP
jgi:hypothetical protein